MSESIFSDYFQNVEEEYLSSFKMKFVFLNTFCATFVLFWPLFVPFVLCDSSKIGCLTPAFHVKFHS